MDGGHEPEFKTRRRGKQETKKQELVILPAPWDLTCIPVETRKGHESETLFYINIRLTDQPTDNPTDRPTDRPGHREVSLPTTNCLQFRNE